MRLIFRSVLSATVALCACGRSAELPPGARVQIETERFPRGWTSGVVGAVGDCPVIMVPDSWSAPASFDVVRLDDVQSLRISTVYDGLPGDDGQPRRISFPPDTAGEEWRSLAVPPLRERYTCNG